MELKSNQVTHSIVEGKWFNRTFMELKCSELLGGGSTVSGLIVPLWN